MLEKMERATKGERIHIPATVIYPTASVKEPRYRNKSAARSSPMVISPACSIREPPMDSPESAP